MDIVDYDDDERPKLPDIENDVFYGNVEDKPPMEQHLFKCQDDFYKAQTDEERLKVWKDMFSSVQIYARSMVLQKMKNKTFLPPEEIDGKATTAAINFMSQYFNRLNFHVGASFGSMINFKVLEAVYGLEKEDQVASINLTEDEKSFDILAMSKKANVTFMWLPNIDDVEEQTFSLEDLLYDFLDEIDEVVDDDLMKLKYRMYFLIVLKKPKNYHVKDTFIKMNCTSKKEVDLLNLVELNLHKRFSSMSFN